MVEEKTKWGESAAKDRLRFLFRNAVKRIVFSQRVDRLLFQKKIEQTSDDPAPSQTDEPKKVFPLYSALLDD